ncbi:2-phospho-L-lactate transferase [Nocardioides gansuensis]|uniref:2-phospho-L-lactate transferase n=1 Tax=Nocardioides gansuensis TaxID=2138300 RepID=A0A2T8F533_9ACTN|nr:2-phospho-L-lactate transferase [Nocardioides gansuensis]PVG80817.1 2-phospho-L-lactate transferase [Nocardioides gansuensis]
MTGQHTFPKRITVLSGGVGGARFLEGLLRLVARRGFEPWTGSTDGEVPDGRVQITVVANTGDDLRLHGLLVCPDLDTVMYTLGGGIDRDRGWGRSQETWNAKEELTHYGVGLPWFGLGDRDLATHLARTQLLAEGRSLSEATEVLCRRWNPGVRLLPMSDDRIETHVLITNPASGERENVHFQEYWIRYGAAVPAFAITPQWAEHAKPAPGVLEAIDNADVVLLPPSNPVVSIGTILSVPGIAETLKGCPAPVIGVSGIIGSDHVRGMARQLLEVVGVEVSAAGVAAHYGSRTSGGLLDGWLIDSSDAAQLPRIEALGIRAEAVPLWMTEPDVTADMVAESLRLASR